MCDYMQDGSAMTKGAKVDFVVRNLRKAEDALSAVATELSRLNSIDLSAHEELLLDIFNDSIGICLLVSENVAMKEKLSSLVDMLTSIEAEANK